MRIYLAVGKLWYILLAGVGFVSLPLLTAVRGRSETYPRVRVRGRGRGRLRLRLGLGVGVG